MCGATKFNMGITQDGIEGEKLLFEFLKKKKIKFFQPDAIAFIKGKYNLFECKHQERYLSPPFDGHGLPKWQVEARLWFWEITGVRPIFFVVEKPSGDIYYNYLDVLEKTEFFDTKGLKPRRIYNLKYFIKSDQTGMS